MNNQKPTPRTIRMIDLIWNKLKKLGKKEKPPLTRAQMLHKLVDEK